MILDGNLLKKTIEKVVVESGEPATEVTITAADILKFIEKLEEPGLASDEKMYIGKACAICEDIENEDYSLETKAKAVKVMLDMETHNSVRKSTMLRVIAYLWRLVFTDQGW